MSLDVVKEAIAARSPIRFQYNKEGKTPGLRIGDPHAVFIFRRKDGTESTKVHVVQTGGVSDSGQEFPSFRMFDLEELSHVELEPSEAPFEISDSYNPEWSGYSFVIAKV